MAVKVGDSFGYKGNSYLVTSIEKRQSQEIAPCGSVQMEADLWVAQNVRHLKLEVGMFEEGDIINITAEWCCLQREQDTQFIYTLYRVEKEGEKNGQNGQSQASNEAAGAAPQAADERSASGEGDGGEGAREGGGTLHGDGPR